MPVKQFSIYPQDLSEAFLQGKQLVVEAGNHHIACIVKSTEEEAIVAFELYTFSAEEMKMPENLLNAVRKESKLFGHQYASTILCINNDLAVLIPSFKFNKEISDDYLRIAHGEDKGFTKFYNEINVDPSIMNVFRVSEGWIALFKEFLKIDSVRHTYTNIIKNALLHQGNTETIFIQFYHHHIIVCATRQQKLLLAQSFGYETPDDVLYYLLNLAHQLNMNGTDLAVHVSGLIDLNSKLYLELVKYFENVQVDSTEHPFLSEGDHSYPSHYFTSFSKLAL